MEWTEDVGVGAWIRDRLDDGPEWGSTMHGVVPRGFPAYVRILHRPTVAWVDGRAYPSQDELRAIPEEEWPETRSAPTSWSAAAAALGATLHPAAQWHALSGGAPHVIGSDGREYSAPEEGRLDPETLAAVARHLASHTTTDAAVIALWDGWGGVTGFFGDTPARVLLTAGGDPDVDARHRAMLERSIRDPFNNVFRKPVWQPGTLGDDVSRGSRLSLPQRDHILFAGTVGELADPDWPDRAPWRDPQGPAAWIESPSLVWPADHAWVLVTEVDYDSTIVGGSVALAAALVDDPALEAFPIPAGADLSWDGDEVNR